MVAKWITRQNLSEIIDSKFPVILNDRSMKQEDEELCTELYLSLLPSGCSTEKQQLEEFFQQQVAMRCMLWIWRNMKWVDSSFFYRYLHFHLYFPSFSFLMNFIVINLSIDVFGRSF